MKKILALALVFMMFGTAQLMATGTLATVTTVESANVTSIQGKIIDKSTGEPLAGVSVKIEGTDQVVYSDFDGNFAFDNVTAGTFTIKVSMVSYTENVLNNLILSANQTSIIQIALDN